MSYFSGAKRSVFFCFAELYLAIHPSVIMKIPLMTEARRVTVNRTFCFDTHFTAKPKG